ncbi:MAG TPA: hypothetical protein VLT87_10865 [Thermoanaerobaculia bacterium]|nr:hypothetical protein [Thermoanaerobaculia bacterium]
MVLGELIERLEQEDPERRVAVGFNRPHSHRADYSELAFEPVSDVSVGEMLAHARAALGATFTGYKGGDYRMGEYTSVHLARWGSCGEEIGRVTLEYILGYPEKALAIIQEMER